MINASRRKRAAIYVGLGLVLYLAFLVAYTPATLLAEGAARLSNGALTLAQPRGTLWRGTGELHGGGRAAGARHIGTLQWRINPWWLLAGRAQFSLQLNGPAARGQAAVRVARRRLSVQGLDAALPANLASLVYAPAAFFEPRGTIELRAPSIDVSAAGLATNLEAQWRGAGGRFTGPGSLGDYRIELNGQGETATIRLNTLRGDLELTGQGQWRVTGDGAINFTGSAVPRGNAAQLEPLLRPLGRDLGNGRREIRFNGRFPLLQQLGYS